LNKQTFDRADASIKSGVSSAENFDTAQANLRTSEANVTAGVAAVGVAKANVGVAAANVRRLENLVSFNRVLAPYAGVVTARNVDTGALISAGQPSSSASTTSSGTTNGTGAGAAASGQATGAQALFRVARTDPLRIYVNVPQAFTPYVRIGSAAGVSVREFPARAFPGTVSRTANSLDPTARTLTTEVLVRNPDGKLLPGMYVQVKFVQTRPKPPVVVPGGALITRTDGTFVAVVGAGDKLEYRRVEVGRDFGTTAEVVLGLAGGERVGVNMVEELPAGTVVEAVPMPQEPAPKN
jgi:multidrug efflux pump subunit AcrA (membrane-fusion protein)